MWGLLAWLVLLAATVVLASVAFHFDVDQLPAAFQALSPTQQVAAILIALVALALTASTLWQSWRLTSQERAARAVQGGILGAKKGAALAASSQKDFDAAVQHLQTNDPEDVLSTVHKQLAESEARLALQRAGVTRRASRRTRALRRRKGRSRPCRLMASAGR